jgi:MarR family transcriptional regulator for hemolysin
MGNSRVDLRSSLSWFKTVCITDYLSTPSRAILEKGENTNLRSGTGAVMAAKSGVPESDASRPSPRALPAGFEDNFGWLLAQCFRAHVLAMDQAVADIPHGHRGFLALSGAANCSAHNQAELAKQLNLDRTVMVYLVDDLEKAGLVERLPDPNDRRSRLIRATDAGRDRLSGAQSAISAAETELLAALSADEQASLRRMLRGLATHYFANGGSGFSPCDIADEARRASV